MDGGSFRFFSPEQIDQILREGAKQGRKGTHAAIERILRHEPGIERAELWKRIGYLKRKSHQSPRRPVSWSPDDDQLLRKGYGLGLAEKVEVIRELLRRHPDWSRAVIWKRAKRLGLVPKRIRRKEESHHERWSEVDDRTLLSLSGDTRLRTIARVLRRSESAVSSRLARLGKRTRLYKDGYARRSLGAELHLGRTTIRRLIVEGFLDVRDPRITKKSIARLKKSGALLNKEFDESSAQISMLSPSADVTLTQNVTSCPQPSEGTQLVRGRASRARRLWMEVARSLNVSLATVRKLIAHGSLKLCDARITEESIRRFCREHGALINYDFLDQETRAWLISSMDLDRRADEDAARRLTAFRKHALVLRRCTKCGRGIRGNGFFRHYKRCRKTEPG